MKVLATSMSASQLTKNNVAVNCDWPFMHVNEYPKAAQFDPDVVYVGGFYVGHYANWQVYRAVIGDAKKVIVHWYGSDTLACKSFYDRGQRALFQELNSDRYVNVPCNDKIAGELKDWFGLEITEPLNVPAETVYLEMPKPLQFKIGVYMPCQRLDFFNAPLICEALAPLEYQTIFYHWLPMTEDLPKIFGHHYGGWGDYRYALSREEYRKTIEDCSCLVRVPVHDAYSISTAEFLMAGRPVVSQMDTPLWPSLIEGDMTPVSLREAVLKAKDLAVPKEVQMHYRDSWSPDLFKNRLLDRVHQKWPEFQWN